MASGEHAGCFGWCMFDYPTHKDCGSGDRVCYHGVMDMFRNPKLAAAVYASQSDESPVLAVGSSMDIGDYPAGNIGRVYAFTNADRVELYKNDLFVASAVPQGWQGLRHGPVAIDDTIGCLLETQEGFGEKKAALVRRCLNAAGKYGLAALPLRDKLAFAWAMGALFSQLSGRRRALREVCQQLGRRGHAWRFDAVKNGAVVASVTKAPAASCILKPWPAPRSSPRGRAMTWPPCASAPWTSSATSRPMPNSRFA